MLTCKESVPSTLPEPDMDEAARFLECLAPGESWSFQTFDDIKARKTRSLNRVLHGSLAKHADELHRLQVRGAGAFVMVNRGNLRGRSGIHVVAIRALFVDLDGAPLEPVHESPLAPHIIVESSPGRFHAYWRVSDCPLDRFTEMQSRLCENFNGDPTVKDLPRVMRMPGFLHLKNEPYRTRILSTNSQPAYRLAQLELAFPQTRRKDVRQKAASKSEAGAIPEGQRNSSILSFGARFRESGVPKEGVIKRIRTLNRERCQTPLEDEELQAIVKSVFRYPCERAVSLSGRELEALNRVKGPAVKAYLYAKRQHDAGNSHVSLTLTDLRPLGFGNQRSVTKAARSLRTAQLLKLERAAVYKQLGKQRKCALYTLPLCAKTH